MSDGGRIDGIDLPSLVSFFVEGNSSFEGSFCYAKLILNSPFILAVSGIDLPSLKSIHVGDGCFRSTPHVEMISEDALEKRSTRSSRIGIIEERL